MSLSTKVVLSLVAGIVAAMLAWIVVDFNGFYHLSDQAQGGTFIQVFSQEAFVGMIFGLLMGTAMGAVNGMSTGSWSRLRQNLAWGAIVGLIGGLLGLYFGQLFFGIFYSDTSNAGGLIPALSPFQFVWNVIVRAIGWAFIGTFIGMVQGCASSSAKTARHGAVGGFIGGLLGGMLFEIVRYLLPPGTKSVSVVSRAIGMTVTGAFIGFFIGLVENLMKQAWIRVVQGRNEGREYIISKGRTTIGRDELADIGLFGDRSVQPLHAAIEVLPGGRHILRDAGSSVGTMVNSQKISEHVLRDGELIQVGSMRLEFHEKATASRMPRPAVDAASKPPVQIPVADGQCPFCGGRKDPITGACACSFTDQQPSVPPAASVPWPGPIPGATIPNQPSSNGARLLSIDGPYAGRTFPVSPTGTTEVGREDGRHVQLAMDTTVSRRHARIANEGGIFVVYDEGSSNGTSVNGSRVSRQELRAGDKVSFGSSTFRFEE